MRVDREGLLEFHTAMHRGYVRPPHLEGYARFLESLADRKAKRGICSMPPRHGKSALVISAIVWLLRKDPTLKIGYATYNSDFAEKHGDMARGLARRAGVALSPTTQSKGEWETIAGGGAFFAGWTSGWTGRGFDILFVDDLVKDRISAESKRLRDQQWDWYTDVAFTRLEPTGSVVINMTRWHKDDIAGKASRGEETFETFKFPAILVDDDGANERPLFPWRWTLEQLKKVQATIGAYSWASLWMQDPRPRGGKLFTDVHFYDRLPPGPYRVGVGIDLAYSIKKRSDSSVIAVFLETQDRKRYALDVVKRQVTAPQFLGDVRAVKADFPGCKTLFRYAGPEKGVIDFFDHAKVKIGREATQGDKFVNAQSYAAAWNVGDIMVPRRSCASSCGPDCDEHPAPEWVEEWVDEHLEFTGIDGEPDDQVDAGISADRVLRGKQIALV